MKKKNYLITSTFTLVQSWKEHFRWNILNFNWIHIRKIILLNYQNNNYVKRLN